MEKSTTFPLPLAGYAVEGLVPEDAPRLQPLYEACADYILLEQGEAPAPDAAAQEFAALPPQRTADDKFVFGILNQAQTMVGVLECNRNYPNEGCWWVGLFMVAPSERGLGVAKIWFEAFVAWVTQQGGTRLELAVITTNERGYRFWLARGFEIIRTTDPRPYGVVEHRLHVMRRMIAPTENA